MKRRSGAKNIADESEATNVTNPETELAGYFARYEIKAAELAKALRAKLKARLAGFFEIVYVYEGQGSTVISYSPSEKGYEGVCSLALDGKGVKLYFTNGAAMAKADPKKLLQGAGKTARFVPMGSVADYERAEIEALMAAALKLSKAKPGAGAKGGMILKADSQKERAQRTAKKAARPAATSREAKEMKTPQVKGTAKPKAPGKGTMKPKATSKPKARTKR